MFIRDYHNPTDLRAQVESIGGFQQLKTLLVRPTAAGITVTETTAMNIAALFRAVTVLAQSQAQVPLEVIQDKQTGFLARPDHRVSDLLNLDANDNDTAFVVREQIAWDAAWHGDGFAEIETNAKLQPAALQYVEARRVQVRWKENKASVPGSVYEREYIIDGDTSRPIPASGMLHLPGLQFNGLNGKGVVQIARESLAHTLAIEQHGATTFGNNGVPAGVIETIGPVDDETKSRMKESFKKNARNDIVVMDGGDKFIPLGLSNEATQFLGARLFQVTEISRWTGVPPHLLMDMSNANYNSLELIGGEFKALTLVPWCERWRGEIRKKLFSKEERRRRYDVRFNYDAFLRADRKTRYDAHRIGITAGFMTRNEARIEEGMTPLPGGDELLTPLNMVNPDDIKQDDETGNSDDSDAESGDTGSTGGK